MCTFFKVGTVLEYGSEVKKSSRRKNRLSDLTLVLGTGDSSRRVQKSLSDTNKCRDRPVDFFHTLDSHLSRTRQVVLPLLDSDLRWTPDRVVAGVVQMSRFPVLSLKHGDGNYHIPEEPVVNTVLERHKPSESLRRDTRIWTSSFLHITVLRKSTPGTDKVLHYQSDDYQSDVKGL